MLFPRVVSAEPDVNARLLPFEVTKAELLEITKAVVAGRSDAVPIDDPATAEGQFAYIYGTRFTRALFRSKGYLSFRREGIEGVRHPKRDLQIVYQSVDLAASVDYAPRAVSGKGAGADRFIDEGQGKLALPEVDIRQHAGGVNTGVWFFCVSVNGDDVRAELSLPAGVGGGNFDGFIERIFVLSEGEWSGSLVREGDGPDPIDFEPVVSRK